MKNGKLTKNGNVMGLKNKFKDQVYEDIELNIKKKN